MKPQKKTTQGGGAWWFFGQSIPRARTAETIDVIYSAALREFLKAKPSREFRDRLQEWRQTKFIDEERESNSALTIAIANVHGLISLRRIAWGAAPAELQKCGKLVFHGSMEAERHRT